LSTGSNQLDTKALPAAFRTTAVLQNLQVTYTASATNQGSNATSFNEGLDGVTLTVDYTPAPTPAFHRESGCIRVAPYGAAGSCALVQTSGANARLALHGTAYAPVAPFDVQLTNGTYQVFERGLIARSLRANLTPACGTCNTPAFSLPPASPGTTTQHVLFQATVRGKNRLRALVDFTPGLPPVVRSWSTMNE
jgi:hypothetical protein